MPDADRARAHRARSSSCRRASSRCRSPRRCTRYGKALGVARAADLRRRSDGAAAPRAQARRRRRRRHAGPRARSHPAQTLQPRRACASSCSTKPTRCSTWASPKTSRRSSRRRRPSGRRRSSRPRCRRASPTIAEQAPQGPGARHASTARSCAAGTAPRVRQVAYIVPRAHKMAALGRVLDVENPTSAHRVLPHAHRGRRAHRDAQRARLPRRGAARRAVAGAARPRDEEVPRQHGRPARSPPTSPRAGSTSSTSRTS